jgi:hypothetical protein
MRRIVLALASLALLASVVERTHAGLVFYPDRTAFNAATTGVTMIGFEGIAPPDGFTFYGHSPLTLSGATFTASTSNLFVESSTYYATHFFHIPYNLGSGDFLLSGNFAPADLSISLPGPSTAFALDLGTFDSINSQVSFKLSSGDTFSVSAPYPTSMFVGFTSTVPITSVDLLITSGDRQDTLSVDNVSFGAIVPEPASLTLFGIGGVAALGYRRWRSRNQHGV